MKSTFKGYIGYTDEEFETLWSNAKFVIDTNIIFMNIIDTLENEIDIMNSNSVEQLNLLNEL